MTRKNCAVKKKEGTGRTGNKNIKERAGKKKEKKTQGKIDKEKKMQGTIRQRKERARK